MPTCTSVVLLDATPLNTGVPSTAECLEVEVAISPTTSVASLIEDLQSALAAMNYASSVPLDHRAALALVVQTGADADAEGAGDTDDEEEATITAPWSPVTPQSWAAAVAGGESTGVLLCGNARLLDNPIVLAALDGAVLSPISERGSGGAVFRVVPAPPVPTATVIASSIPSAAPLFPDPADVAVDDNNNDTDEDDEGGDMHCQIGSSVQTGGARTVPSTHGERMSERPLASESGPRAPQSGAGTQPASPCAVEEVATLSSARLNASQLAALSSRLLARGRSPFDTLQWAGPDDTTAADPTRVVRQLSTLPTASPDEVRAAREALALAMRREYQKMEGIFNGAAGLQPAGELPLLRHHALTAMAEEAALYEAEASRLQTCAQRAQQWQSSLVSETRAHVQQLEAQVLQRRGQKAVAAQLQTQLSALQAQLDHHRAQEVQLVRALRDASLARGGQRDVTSTDASTATPLSTPPTPPLRRDEMHRRGSHQGQVHGSPSALDEAIQRALRPPRSSPPSHQGPPRASATPGGVWVSSDSKATRTTTSTATTTRSSSCSSRGSDSPPRPPPLPEAPSQTAALAAVRAPPQEPPKNRAAVPGAEVADSQSPGTIAQVQYSESSSPSSSSLASSDDDVSPAVTHVVCAQPPRPSRTEPQTAPATAGGWNQLQASFNAHSTTTTTTTTSASADDDDDESEARRVSGESNSDQLEAELDALRQVSSQLSAHLRSPKPDPGERRQLLGEVRTLRQRLDARSLQSGRRDPLRPRTPQ